MRCGKVQQCGGKGHQQATGFRLVSTVPKEAERRANWDSRINRREPEIKELERYRVCCDHFRLTNNENGEFCVFLPQQGWDRFRREIIRTQPGSFVCNPESSCTSEQTETPPSVRTILWKRIMLHNASQPSYDDMVTQ